MSGGSCRGSGDSVGNGEWRRGLKLWIGVDLWARALSVLPPSLLSCAILGPLEEADAGHLNASLY